MKVGDIVKLKSQKTRKIMEQWAIGKLLVVVSLDSVGTHATVRTVANLREMGCLRAGRIEVANERG